MTVESPNVLRFKLDGILEQARLNERKLRRFQSLELKLIGTNSMFELIHAIIYPDQVRFKWDVVTLLLLDPEYEIQRTLEEEGVQPADHPRLMFATEQDAIDSLYPMSLFPLLGPYRPRKHARLFGGQRKPPASIMLLPLVRHGRLIGSLNIGSYTADHFAKGVRTDFFEHFAAVVAICLENSANLERLKKQGLTDTLTAINNRRFFDQRLKEEMNTARRNEAPLTCLLLDIDYFKRVNDRHGHQVGDQVLMEVAALIRAQMRGSDVLSRYGGEEFAALLAMTREDEALEVAERIRSSVAARRFDSPAGDAFSVTISIGVATYEPLLRNGREIRSGSDLVGCADEALYQCKAQGRNRVVSYSGDSIPVSEKTPE